MTKERQTVHWNIPAPGPLNEALEKFITSNFHMTKSEFIREAVREKLAKHGVVHEPAVETKKVFGVENQ